MNKPFVEKYRPQDFDQVEGNREVINCLQKITETKIIPNMLLYGPPGTGKTTCIRILSSILPNTSVLELNASDERGISIVRNTIKEFASTYSNTIKLVILDEADFMTRDAQNALRRIMEDYSANTRFCLIANYPKKIIPPILSRCSKFRFSPVCDMGKRISTICDAENIQIDEQGIQFLIKTSYGDMRKVVNDIQGIIKAYGIINKHTVLKFNGIMSDEEYKDVFDILTQRKYDEILMQLEALKESKSIDLLSIITYITDYVLQSKLKNKLLLLKKMSEIECRLNAGCSEEVQMNGLISAFVLYR